MRIAGNPRHSGKQNDRIQNFGCVPESANSKNDQTKICQVTKRVLRQREMVTTGKPAVSSIPMAGEDCVTREVGDEWN